MKTIDTTRTVESSGITESGDFRIKTTAAAFQLLSSGLYSNKIRAVVRELSCNALDAHVSAGKDSTPIEVKIPNRLDSQFYVKDQGPGLSHEQIMHMYTTYFDSTKQETNELIGGFGVGSKSPFSYTDSFSVESRHGGKRRLYTAFLSENGVPQIALLGTSDMEPGEHTGLTVSMPVKPEDHNRFYEEAKSLFAWYTPVPTIEGAASIEPMKLKTMGPDVYVYEANPTASHHFNHNQKLQIKVGHVVYAIDDLVQSQDADATLREAMRTLEQFKVVLNVPIGSVSIAASREKLAYDKNTRAYLASRIHDAVDVLFDGVMKELDKWDPKKFEDRTQASLFYQRMFGHVRYYGHSQGPLLTKAQMNSRSLKGSGAIHQNQIPLFNRVLEKRNVSPDKYVELLTQLPQPTIKRPLTLARGHQIEQARYNTWDAYGTTAPQLVYQDIPKEHPFYNKAKKNFALRNPVTRGYADVVLISPTKPDDPANSQHVESLLAEWGMEKDTPVKNLSTFLSAPDKKHLDMDTDQDQVPAITLVSKTNTTCSATGSKFYYIETGNGYEPTPPKGWSQSYWKACISALRESAATAKRFLADMGASTEHLGKLYMVNATHVDKVRAFPNAKSLTEFLANVPTSEKAMTVWNQSPGCRAERLSSFMTHMVDNKKDYPEWETTQLGQFVSHLRGLPTWNEDSKDKTAKTTEFLYAEIGSALAQACPSEHRMENKLWTSNSVSEVINNYYPMLRHVYSYELTKNHQALAYVSWSDSHHSTPLIPGLTTIPEPPSLETLLAQHAAQEEASKKSKAALNTTAPSASEPIASTSITPTP